MSGNVTHRQASKLLHNKFVVILGASVQRSMYKDLVLLLQKDTFLTMSQLKTKGEMSFEKDSLVEGGHLGPVTNGTDYREVRQYCSDHHLVRFYFLTRVYSPYMESVLEDLRSGLKPDAIVVSSCLWDISRYDPQWSADYRQNLHTFFQGLRSAVCDDCLILWLLTMPLGSRLRGGFFVPTISHLAPTLRFDVIEANFCSFQLAHAYGLDVLDLHFHFRLRLNLRMADGIHWNAAAHRSITSRWLQHLAGSWGVKLIVPTAAPLKRSYCVTNRWHGKTGFQRPYKRQDHFRQDWPWHEGRSRQDCPMWREDVPSQRRLSQTQIPDYPFWMEDSQNHNTPARMPHYSPLLLMNHRQYEDYRAKVCRWQPRDRPAFGPPIGHHIPYWKPVPHRDMRRPLARSCWPRQRPPCYSGSAPHYSDMAARTLHSTWSRNTGRGLGPMGGGPAHDPRVYRPQHPCAWTRRPHLVPSQVRVHPYLQHPFHVRPRHPAFGW